MNKCPKDGAPDEEQYEIKSLSPGRMVVVIMLITSVLLLSCNRRVHTQRTENRESSGEAHLIDSLSEVTRTLSEAYEELLKSTTGTEVTFIHDTVVSAQGNPHVILYPDGRREFSGVSSFRENTSIDRRISSLRQQIIDSMNRYSKRDTVYKEAERIETVRTVRTRYIPWWMYAALGLAVALWLNSKFRFITISKIKAPGT